MEDSKDEIKLQLKALLLHLAAESNQPGADLQNLVCEVVEELYLETEQALRDRSHLRLLLK